MMALAEKEPMLETAKSSKSKAAGLGENCAKFWQSNCGKCLIGCSPCVLFLLYILTVFLIYMLAHQTFQCWALQYPWIANLMNTPIEVVDSLYVGRSDAFIPAREKYGSNFCAAGMVWLGSFKDVSQAVTSPQARSYQLGEHPLLPRNLPDVGRSRLVFLLSLSDKGAGGSGEHAAFRQCFIDHMFSESDARRKDSTAESLLQTLAQDYADLPHETAADEFFSDPEKGMLPFITKYLHYVLFGIDPTEKETFEILESFYAGQNPIGHYFWPHGYFMSYTDLIHEVSDIYIASPAFEKWEDNKTEYFNMTKHELGTLSAAIMRIAGVQGFQQISKIVLGAFKLPVYPGADEEGFDQRTVWDSLDLEDTQEIQQYIMECTRLDTPVSVTHRVATEQFSVESRGKQYTFPSGTRIGIPLALGNTDKEFWGDDAFEFDHHRPDLMDNILSFNSVGDKHPGRECPGKELVMETLTLMLQRLGKVRREADKGASDEDL